MTRYRPTPPGIRRAIAITVALAVLGGVAIAQSSPPHRRAGWWETTMTMKLGPRDQTMVTQDCTDDTSEKERSVLSAGAAVRGNCSRREVSQIAGGWQSTSVCNFGSGPQTTTATVTGDFQSHVHIEQVSQSARGPSRMVMDMKWLGACPAGRRPGDVVGAGGQVFNMASPPQH